MPQDVDLLAFLERCAFRAFDVALNPFGLPFGVFRSARLLPPVPAHPPSVIVAGDVRGAVVALAVCGWRWAVDVDEGDHLGRAWFAGP